MDLKLKNKVAIVTGPAKGMGAAISLAFAREGVHLALAGRDLAAIEPVALEARAIGVKVIVVKCDVTQAADCEHVVREAAALGDGVDILVNVAGGSGPIGKTGWETTPEEFDQIVELNMKGCFNTMRAVLPGMIARKHGKIVHIASLMSELARPSVVPYTAAKGGVRQLTRGMAVELAPHNIQVNAIAPGYFATEMNRALIDDAEFNAWVCKRTPAGRWGDPHELGGLAVFLASPAANYMTGQLVIMDGGMSVAL